jgi:DNA replication licensing factor MCM6
MENADLPSDNGDSRAQINQMGDSQDVAEYGAQVNGSEAGNRRDRPRNEAQTFTADGSQLLELVDEGAELVKSRFLDFLQHYTEPLSSHLATTNPLGPFSIRVEDDVDGMDQESDDGEKKSNDDNFIYFPYLYQASQLSRYIISYYERSGDSSALQTQPRSTLFVDFCHIINHNAELAEAIEYEHERFEPYLRKALRIFLSQAHPEVARYIECEGVSSSDGGNGSAASSNSSQAIFFAVAFYNHPKIVAVRDMRMDKIGRLSSFCGTITRTSEVRPELISASFRCEKCGLLSSSIRQEYHYTRPALCKNPRCDNTFSWMLEHVTSEFVDWQKVRVQENADEIPPGSMPRSVDVILRNDFVETAKAGDKSVFVGTLIVVPDANALSRTGEAVIAQRSSSAAGDVGNMGVRGLKAMGVREMTYRTCFVAHCVIPMNVASLQNKGDKQRRDTPAAPQDLTQPQLIEIILKNMPGNLGDASYAYRDTATPEEVAMEYTEEEKDAVRNMKNTPQLYKKMAQSIAPNIFGHEGKLTFV